MYIIKDTQGYPLKWKFNTYSQALNFKYLMGRPDWTISSKK